MTTATLTRIFCLAAALLATSLPARSDDAAGVPQSDAAAMPAPAPSAIAKAPSGRFLNLVLRDSIAHRQTLLALYRGKKNVPFWVRGMISHPVYISAASEQAEIDGRSYELFSACSPKICADSNLRVLFAPDGKAAWLRISDPATGEIFFGAPSEAQKQVLQKSGL